MVEDIGNQQRVQLSRRRAKAVVIGMLLVLTSLTVFLRVWKLNSIPPWLFSDEAAYGLDVREILQGEFRVFFPRNLGREPLFNYLAVPFVAVADGTPIAIRLGAAIMGILMVPALFLTGKALWRESPRKGVWAGMAAAAFWMTNYWPQSVNRIAFHANTLPLFLTLAVLAWLNWTHRPTRQRALAFGFLAGLTLATYLAARITPLLWLLLCLALPSVKRKPLRGTLPWALLAFLLAIAPLIVYFALHPGDFLTRMGFFGVLDRAVTPMEHARLMLGSMREVAGVFLGGAGDPIPRHNLPGRPPFPFYLAILFVLGLGWALWSLRRRDQRAWTLLLWLAALSIPAILAADVNPHFLRLFGALPAAFLLAAWPVAWLGDWTRGKHFSVIAAAVALLVLLIGAEGVRTARDYFVTWAHETDLYYEYSGDMWVLGEQIAQTPGAIGVVPLSLRYPSDFREFTLDYGFPDTPLLQMQVDEEEIEEWLDEHVGNAGGSQVMVPVWLDGMHIVADPKGVLTFYLTREGSVEDQERFRGFDLLTFSLKTDPQFRAVGHRESPNQLFSSTLTLVEARYGVGYPNPDSNEDSAAAGTPIWAILTWRLERPSSDLKVALDLVDSGGHRLASSELPLTGAQGIGVSEMSTGALVQTYHLVTVPPTQPPGSVVLEARAYDAQTLVPLIPLDGTERGSVAVGTVSVSAALEPQTAEGLSVSHPMQVVFPPGITLLGLDPWPAEIAPGQKLTLRLFWQAETPPSNGQSYAISLKDTEVSTTVHLPPELPVGQVVHTYADLSLPPELPNGTFELVLTAADGISPVKLGEVDVVGRPHRFEAPPLQMPLRASFGDAVALMGLDVAGDMSAAPGQTLEFGLVWKVMNTPEEELVRFVHLLGPDGRPVAQEDTVPCGGECPASSWLQDEVLLEEARLSLPADLPAGSYSLALGWYDASTLERLAATDASGQPLADDLLILPLHVEVAP